MATKEPYDPRAERECISGVLADKVFDVLGFANPNDFFVPEHVTVMAAAAEMARLGERITMATICEHLRTHGDLSTAVVNAMEHALDKPSPFPEGAAKIVKQMSHLRSTRKMLVDHVTEIDSGKASPERVVTSVISRAIALSTGGKERSRSADDVANDVSDHIKRIQGDELVSFTTTISGVDIAIGGVQPGEMLGLTGPPGSCKSLLKNRINLSNSKEGTGVASYILEMSVNQEMIRAVSIEGKGEVDAKKFRGGRGVTRPTLKEVEAFEKHMTTIRKLPLWMDNTKFNLMEIVSDAERRVQENGVRIITIDYAQLIQVGDGGNRTGELERISQAFRMFAQKNDCAVVMVVRLDKAGALSSLKGNQLTGAELHGSSSFHYDFSSLVALYFDKPMWLCKCPIHIQFEYNAEKESYQSVHPAGMHRLCSTCGTPVKVSDGRMGNAYVLKARDGDSFARIPLMLEGSSLQIKELDLDGDGFEEDEEETADAATVLQFPGGSIDDLLVEEDGIY